MPETPRMPPGRRCFARIDRFECACPHCGRLIFAGLDRKFLPKRLQEPNRARAAAKQRPRAASVLRMFWNPHTQRLACPWCDHVFTVGLVFYPHPRGKHLPVPLDVEPTAAEVAELRRLAGGWFVSKTREVRHHANLSVQAECSCPLQGTDPSCALHGTDALNGTRLGGESQ